MDTYSIELVQDSWARVAWNSPKVISIFHIELFNRDLEAQGLFVGEKDKKITAMMKAIDFAIGNLYELEFFTPFLQDFGRRHRTYGVSESHYQSFFDALLSTLGQVLGHQLTPDARDAWIDIYQRIGKIMIDASRQSECCEN